MKTVKEIDQEISDILKSLKKDSKEGEVKKAKRDVAFLRQIRLYLITDPREEFIKSELNEVQRKIDLIPTHYEGWKVGKTLTKYKDPYAIYCNEMHLPDLRAQIKTLEFILS